MHLFSLRTLWVCFFGMYLLIGSLPAQIFEGPDAARILPNASRIWQDEATGALKYVRLQQSTSLPPGEGEGWLRDALQLRPEDRFHLYQRKEDQMGFRHYRYRQHYQGLPVLNGVYYLHYQGQVLHSANGEFYPQIQVNTTPGLDEAAARTAAEAAIGAKAYGWQDSPSGSQPSPAELLVMVDQNQMSHLAYRFDIKVAAPFGRYYVLVDAHSGTILAQYDRIHTANAVATAETKYRGTKTMDTDSTAPNDFRLRDYTRGGGIETYDLNTSTNYGAAIDFLDADNYWDVVANQDDAANDAHWGTAWTYDYFYQEHGLDSYDGNGATMLSYIHYGSNFLNAFWNGTAMTYGDGNGAGATALTSIDIVAHEITHGITENSAGLIYSYESGALNESFSDIFGVVLDFYSDSAQANWLMGDEIGFTFRNAANPNQYSHPDTYLGTFWWTSPGDNGGVHINSGVQNFWFYLLTMGGSGTNDIGNAYSVNAIGMEKASDISYRNLSVYLTPSSQFADARFYAIQAADDLYGSCSQEVISTTNAWYAVGLGGLFNNAVQAGFGASQTYSCSVPATVNFVNNSYNSTTYAWDFGDGGTSTAVAPSHTYTATGTYTVSLIANGTAICGNSDTLTQTNFITVTNNGAPVAAACAPATINGGFQNAGIYQMDFHTISKSSGSGAEGYQDFTCTHQATVTEGLAYPLTVLTSSTTPEDVKVWIDLDNDGAFTGANELVYFSDNVLQTHSDTLIIPGGALLNTSLRMRVGSDLSNQVLSVCNNPFGGQFEDYGITILANTSPPEANFTGFPLVVSPGQTVNFQDQTLNLPTSWEWEFVGGTPTTSTQQNPAITYNTLGTFPVKLKVTNGFGTDSVTKVGYVSVSNTYTMCTDNGSNALAGIIYDSGGPTGTYSNNENCSFLISPGCADSIVLNFTSFNLEFGYDYLWVYDGTTLNDPLLFSGSGTNLPNAVYASSGSMLVRFTSDGSVILNGFEASWNTIVTANNPPVADFSTPGGSVPLAAPIQFSDLTSNSPSFWVWDLGDGSSSIDQNPVHSYANPGSYTVTLIADNCIATDTISKTITVQGPPASTITPDSINVVLSACNDSATELITIFNGGPGDLVYDMTVSSGGGQVGGAMYDDFEDNDISDWTTGFNVTATPTTTAPAEGSYALDMAGTGGFYQGMSRSFAPDSSDYISFYVKAGTPIATQGYVVIGDQNLPNTNGAIFLYFYMQGFSNEIVLYADFSNQVNVPAVDNQWYFFEFKNIDYATKTFDYYVNDTLRAAAFPFRDQLATHVSQIELFNLSSATAYYDAINIGGVPLGGWLSVAPDSGLVAVGDTSYVTATLNGNGLASGTYYGQIDIVTNDPSAPLVSIPTTLTITAPAEIVLEDTCVAFGPVIQNDTKVDTFLITNPGCDTLDISSMTTGTSFFSANPVPLSILPGATDTVFISFGPLALGTYADTLTLITNAGDTTICLSGTATGAPIMQVNPTAINDTLYGCGDSLLIDLWVSNPGMGFLEWEATTASLLTDAFDPDYDPTLWSTVFQGTAISTCGSTSGSNALMFNGGGQRYAETVDLNLTSVNEVSFELVYGASGSPCEAPDSGEGCYLEYSLDGGLNWLPINYYDPFVFGGGAFNSFVEPLPVGAQTASTRLRWVQISNSGNDFDNWGLDDVAIGSGGNAQISLSPTADTTAAGDSILVTILFDGAGLNGGTYSTNISFLSNDPLNPIVTVPVTITLIGTPVLTLSDTCLDVGTTQQYLPLTQSLTLGNTGCDTLDMTLLPTHPAFSLSDSSLSLPPDSSYTITVTFLPDTVGTYSGLLDLFTNAGDSAVCLSGIATGAPLLDVNPDSLVATANCGDSVTLTLTLYNIGSGVLDIDDIVAGSQGGGDSSVLVIQDFAAWGVNMDTFLLNNFGVNPTVIPSFSIANTNLEDYDLVITVGDQSSSYYADLSNALPQFEAYVNGGGIMQYQGATQGANISLPDGVAIIYPDFTNINYNVLPTHPIMINQADTLFGNSANHTYLSNLPPSADILTETDLTQNPTTAVYPYGDGLIVATGMTWEFLYINQYNSGPMMEAATAFSLGTQSTPVDWVTINPDSGAINAGDSLVVTVTLQTTGLQAGTYITEILIYSNDPLNPVYAVPLTFTVNGTADISIAAPCIDFGNIVQFQTATDSVWLTNTGCDTLSFSAFIDANSDFSTDGSNQLLAPGDSFAVVVDFVPQMVGSYGDSVTIFSNVGTATICLTGFATGAPIISVAPNPIVASGGSCQDSVTIPLTVYNTGAGGLVYNAEGGAEAYDSTSTQNFIFSGQRTDHVFMNVNPSADSGMLIITVNGDFDNTFEYADIYIDSVLLGPAADGTQLFATDIIDTFLLGGAIWDNAKQDGVVEIWIQNTNAVNLGGTNLHQAQLMVEGAEWITINPDQGLVGIGDSAILDVTFDLSGLAAGTYYTTVTFYTNDPVNNPYVVPCTLTVTDGPLLTVGTDNCVEFGNVALGSTATQTLTLYNTGCDFLAITFLGTTNGQYSVTPGSLAIAEGDSADITLSFSPGATGAISADLLINTLIGNSVVCLNGEGGLAPAVGIGDTTLTINLPPCTESYVDYLLLSNVGGGSLSYSTGTSPLPWMTIMSPNGNIAAGDTAQIPLVFAAAGQPAGTYQINIQVQTGDPGMPVITFYLDVVVPADPCANFGSEVEAPCSSLVHFTDSTSNNPTSWMWDFGDGNTATDQNPDHGYTSTGTFTVTLIAVNGVSADTVSQQVEITGLLNPSMSYNGLLNIGEPITFTAGGVPTGTGALWTFGDGVSALGASFTHTYDSAGTYTVHLTVTDSAGCSMTIEQTLVIGFKVGLQEGIGFRGFKLYPNPNLGTFWVDYEPLSRSVALEITNPLGQLILTRIFDQAVSIHEQIILPQGAANGVYTVRMLDGELQVLGRVFYND